MDDPEAADVIQSLLSVFLIKNSHVPGTGIAGSGPAAISASFAFFAEGEIGLGGMPVGALAMARKIGLTLSSEYHIIIKDCKSIVRIVPINIVMAY